MTVTLPKSVFASELAAVSAAIKAKQTIFQSLSYALLSTHSAGLSIAVTDLDCWYKRIVEADVKTPGECLIPLRIVREWLALWPDGSLTVSFDGKRVSLCIDGGQPFHKSTIPVADFPTVPDGGDQSVIATVDLTPIAQVLFAATTNPMAREYLYGIYVEPDGMDNHEIDDGSADLIACAANGVQVATIKFQGQQTGLQFIFIRSPMVPLIASLGECVISDSKNFTTYTTPSCVLMVRKSEIVNPLPWRPLLAQHPVIGGFNVLLEDLTPAIGSCHCLRDAEEGGRILFSQHEAGVSVAANTTAGSFQTIIAAKNTGDWPACLLPSDQVLTFLNEQKRRECDVLKFRFTGHFTLVKVNAGPLDWYVQPIADSRGRAAIESIQSTTV